MNRGIRLKDAPKYLGIDRHEFNNNYRDLLTEIRIGRRVIFDRVELDDLFTHNIKTEKAIKHSGGAKCQSGLSTGCTSEGTPPTSRQTTKYLERTSRSRELQGKLNSLAQLCGSKTKSKRSVTK